MGRFVSKNINGYGAGNLVSLNSPIFSGEPKVPTAEIGTNTTQIATTAFVNTEIITIAAPIAHVGSLGNSHGLATPLLAGFLSSNDKTKLDKISFASDGTLTQSGVTSVAGKTGVVSLAKADVGLGSVDNTADTAKPVSTAQATADTAVQTAAATDATSKANAAQAAAIAASAPVAHVGAGGVAHANAVAAGAAGFMTGADKTKLDGIAAGATVAPVTSVASRTGAVVLTKTDVGLGSVDNTADTAKPVSTAQATALGLKADLASPTLTGVPAAPTATLGTSTTQIATTAFVNAEIASDAAPIAHVGSGATAHAVVTVSRMPAGVDFVPC